MTICLDDLTNICGVVLDELVKDMSPDDVGIDVSLTTSSTACRTRFRRLALTRVTDVLCVEAMRSQMAETDFAFRQLQASLADFDPLLPDPAVGAR